MRAETFNPRSIAAVVASRPDAVPRHFAELPGIVGATCKVGLAAHHP
jgi:hypothetical protein